MHRASKSPNRLVIALASDRDRQFIYRLRHQIYARELAHHEESADGLLQDSLDAFNTYVVALLDGEIAGFISITPPEHRPAAGGSMLRYSFEKYLSPHDLPVPIDDGLYEIRLLTVAERHRGQAIARLLMYAALRWVESLGGRRIVAIGREEVKSIYLKAGLQPFVRRVRAGAVTFEMMSATVEALRCRANRQDRLLAKLARRADWDLGVPFWPPAGTGGGEVDPRADLRRLTAAGPWRPSRTSSRRRASRTTA